MLKPNVHAVQLNVFKCHLYFCCGVTISCITTRAKNLDCPSRILATTMEKTWKLEMADRFFFNDYLTQKRMNEWLNGWSKENTVTINYTPHLYTPCMAFIRKFQFFNKSHRRHLDEHEHTHTHDVHTHSQKKRHSMILSYFNGWKKKTRKSTRTLTKKKHASFRAATYYYYYCVCVLFCCFSLRFGWKMKCEI